MEEAGNIGSCSEGIGQVATRNRADKVSKESKDLTHLTSINSHKVVHLWEIGAHSFSNNFFVANCQDFSGELLFLLLTMLKTVVTSAFNNLQILQRHF